MPLRAVVTAALDSSATVALSSASEVSKVCATVCKYPRDVIPRISCEMLCVAVKVLLFVEERRKMQWPLPRSVSRADMKDIFVIGSALHTQTIEQVL